jgi:hypothetical protein
MNCTTMMPIAQAKKIQGIKLVIGGLLTRPGAVTLRSVTIFWGCNYSFGAKNPLALL